MKTFTHPMEERKNKACACTSAQKKQAADPDIASLTAGNRHFIDNRPETAAQRKLGEMINSSPRMAAQMKMLQGLTGPALQRQEFPEEDELAQGKFAVQRQEIPDEDELFQGKFTAQAQIDEDELLQEKPVQKMENATGMPDGLKTKMDSAFNTDFSGVKIHSNSDKATNVGALAYTQGTDIHFGPGQFKPDTSKGRELLGHELTHVIQQEQGRVKPTTEVQGIAVNDDPGLEKEADNLGRKAAG